MGAVPLAKVFLLAIVWREVPVYGPRCFANVGGSGKGAKDWGTEVADNE